MRAGVLAPAAALVLAILFAGAAAGDTIVSFPDANLEAGVRSALGISAPAPITATGMLGLTSLSLTSMGIADLTGLQYATNLQKLWLSDNNISDLGPIAGLGNLTFLTIDYNPLATNLAPLSGLSRLEVLFADENGISDIAPLAALTNLTSLGLERNLITDISPLKDLANLHRLQLLQNHIAAIPVLNMPGLSDLGLAMNEITDISSLVASNLSMPGSWDLRGNPLNQQAYEIYIPQLLAAYPFEMVIAYGPVPEPGTLVLIAVGLLFGVVRRRRFEHLHAMTARAKARFQSREGK
jgi:hypothetical protein